MVEASCLPRADLLPTRHPERVPYNSRVLIDTSCVVRSFSKLQGGRFACHSLPCTATNLP
jgi:hypothetical protein